MNAKRQLILITVIGFFAGAAAAAAWLNAGHRAGDSSSSSGMAAPDGKGAGPAAASSAAGKDVVSAWEALKHGREQGLPRRLAELELLARATTRDMPRLLELAGGDQNTRALLIRRWVALDPAGAADWVSPLLKHFYPGIPGREQDVAMVFSEWGLKDPAAAMTRLRAKAPVDQFTFASGAAFDRMIGGGDMAAAVRFGALMGSSSTLNGYTHNGTVQDWAAKDPARAAALLSALPPGEFRDINLGCAMSALAKTDFAAALALRNQFPEPGGDQFHTQVRDGFYQEWARRDADGMAAALDQTVDFATRERMREALVSARAETDPVGALNWAAENLNAGAASDSAKEILKKLTLNDPAAALAWLDSQAAGFALNGAVESFCEALPENSGHAILAQGESLPEGDARKSLTARAYEALYEEDPAALVKDLAAKAPEDLPSGIWRKLGEKTETLASALERVKTLPPGADVEFLTGLFATDNISSGSLGNFTQALDSLTVPEQRDAAFKAGVRTLLTTDLPSTINWAKTLPAPDRSFVSGLLEQHNYGLPPAQNQELRDSLR